MGNDHRGNREPGESVRTTLRGLVPLCIQPAAPIEKSRTVEAAPEATAAPPVTSVTDSMPPADLDQLRLLASTAGHYDHTSEAEDDEPIRIEPSLVAPSVFPPSLMTRPNGSTHWVAIGIAMVLSGMIGGAVVLGFGAFSKAPVSASPRAAIVADTHATASAHTVPPPVQHQAAASGMTGSAQSTLAATGNQAPTATPPAVFAPVAAPRVASANPVQLRVPGGLDGIATAESTIGTHVADSVVRVAPVENVAPINHPASRHVAAPDPAPASPARIEHTAAPARAPAASPTRSARGTAQAPLPAPNAEPALEHDPMLASVAAPVPTNDPAACRARCNGDMDCLLRCFEPAIFDAHRGTAGTVQHHSPSARAEPTDAEIEMALASVADDVRICSPGTTGRTTLNLSIAASGRITRVNVGLPFAGTPLGSCIARALRHARVEAFEGPMFQAQVNYRIPQ